MGSGQPANWPSTALTHLPSAHELVSVDAHDTPHPCHTPKPWLGGQGPKAQGVSWESNGPDGSSVHFSALDRQNFGGKRVAYYARFPLKFFLPDLALKLMLGRGRAPSMRYVTLRKHPSRATVQSSITSSSRHERVWSQPPGYPLGLDSTLVASIM